MADMLQFFSVMAGVIGIPMLIIFGVPPLAKAAARRIEQGGRPADDTLAELDALRAEVDALRAMAPRLMELEERVDFAERLIAQGDDARVQQALPGVRS